MDGNEALVDRIAADPAYRALARERAWTEWGLTIVMVGAFIGYTLLVAFAKGWLAQPVGDGVTSIGIPIGIGLILFAILLTGVYVVIANRRYDRQLADILARVGA